MPDVGKYDARDRRHAETIELVRRWKIAEQIPELGRARVGDAVWLFCNRTGFRKITDMAWFAKHMAPGETVEEFRLRLWCDGCRRAGCLSIIPAPSSISHLGFDMQRPEVRALFIRDL